MELLIPLSNLLMLLSLFFFKIWKYTFAILLYFRLFVKKLITMGSIFISVIKKQSGKLIRQPVYFPQRGKSTYSSARSPLRGTMPARLRMAPSQLA